MPRTPTVRIEVPHDPPDDLPPCSRCAEPGCVGGLDLLACRLQVDGMEPMAEALALLAEKYRPPEPAPIVLEIELLGGDRLIPWDPELDRRPKLKSGPRIGALPRYGAGYGECTMCVKEQVPLQAAIFRREGRHGTTQASYCKDHGDYVVRQMQRALRRPTQVPQFANAEEAQQWLDNLTSVLED